MYGVKLRERERERESSENQITIFVCVWSGVGCECVTSHRLALENDDDFDICAWRILLCVYIGVELMLLQRAGSEGDF